MLTFQQFVQLDEISLARLHRHLDRHMQGREVGMITAWRSKHPDHPEWEKVKDLKDDNPTKKAWLLKVNKARNVELEKTLKSWVANYEPGNQVSYRKVRGRFVENQGTPEAKNVDEHSFLVIGKKGSDQSRQGSDKSLKALLRTQGEKYDQDSILHKPHNSDEAFLVGTNKSKSPGLGRHVNVGKFRANRTPMFHSVLAGGGVNSGKQGEKTIRQKGTGNMVTRNGPASAKKWAHEPY
jgi:hypothetical protein